MRLYTFPIIALALHIAIDLWMWRVLLSKMWPKWIRTTHIAISAVLLVVVVAAVSAIYAGSQTVGLQQIMWILFTYISIYIPKYFAAIIAALLYIPKFFGCPHQRFRFVIAGIVWLLLFFIMWWGALITRNQIEVRQIAIESPKIPSEFNGYRIAQFSDIHLGTYGNDTTLISRIVDQINDLNPDLICFTGDIVNSTTEEAYPFEATLKRLSAQDGILSILGNHDYGDYHKWQSPSDRDHNNRQLANLEARLGWTLLNNSDTILRQSESQICLIGVENWGEPPFPQYGRLADAHSNLYDDTYKILLSHNPKHWRAEVLTTSNIDLTLSGHTHAMQVELRLFGHRVSIARLKYEEWGGLYNSNGQLLYVNTGIGQVAVPMRIGAKPEITLFTLRHTD